MKTNYIVPLEKGQMYYMGLESLTKTTRLSLFYGSQGTLFSGRKKMMRTEDLKDFYVLKFVRDQVTMTMFL